MVKYKNSVEIGIDKKDLQIARKILNKYKELFLAVGRL